MLLIARTPSSSCASWPWAFSTPNGKALGLNQQLPLVDEAVRLEIGAGNQFTFFNEKGFRILFQKVMAGRLCARIAGTVVGTADVLADPSGALTERGQALLAAAETCRDADSFLVGLEGALLEEATSWRDLVDLVAELEEQIVSIEAKTDAGRVTLFERK